MKTIRVSVGNTTREVCGAEELQARYTRQNGFYGKAHTFQNGAGKIALVSYRTLVCYTDGGTLRVNANCPTSPTTMRHVREFCNQYAPHVDTSIKGWRGLQDAAAQCYADSDPNGEIDWGKLETECWDGATSAPPPCAGVHV